MYRSEVLEALKNHFTYIVDKITHSKKFKKADYAFYLLRTLPIIHFLRGDCTQHQAISLLPSKFSWGDNTLKLNAVRYAIINQPG